MYNYINVDEEIHLKKIFFNYKYDLFFVPVFLFDLVCTGKACTFFYT
jgi:hypothetical protein